MKTVLFDLDGTLLPMDMAGFEKIYFGGLCAAFPEIPAEDMVKYIWYGTKAMVKNDGSVTNEAAFAAAFNQVSPISFEAASPRFLEYYANGFSACKQACHLGPLSRQIVTTLKEKGYQVAIATNPIFPQIATYARLRWVGLDPEEFPLVTTYENSVHAKPNPDYYRDVCRKLGVAPEECLMVGNDVLEDGCATQLGMQVCLLSDCLLNPKQLPLPTDWVCTLAEFARWAEEEA